MPTGPAARRDRARQGSLPPPLHGRRDGLPHYFFGLSTNHGTMWSKVTTFPMPVATMNEMP